LRGRRIVGQLAVHPVQLRQQVIDHRPAGQRLGCRLVGHHPVLVDGRDHGVVPLVGHLGERDIRRRHASGQCHHQSLVEGPPSRAELGRVVTSTLRHAGVEALRGILNLRGERDRVTGVDPRLLRRVAGPQLDDPERDRRNHRDE